MRQHFERIQALRKLMVEHQLDAYIAVAGDPHGTEYLHPHFKGRDWLTGFTGSRGTALVTADKALLWTDGRYFIQAGKELQDSGVEMLRIGFPEDPTLPEWLVQNLEPQSRIGFDGMAMPCGEASAILKAFGDTPVTLEGSKDLIGQLWTDRPLLPKDPALVHALTFAGQSVSDKLTALRTELSTIAEGQAKKGQPITGGYQHLICKLDDIAWLTNLRGTDIPNNPYVFSFMLVDAEGATLYLDEEKRTAELGAHLAEAGIALRPYAALLEDLRAIGPCTYLIEEASTPYGIAETLRAQGTVIAEVLPTTRLKAIKSPVEQSQIRAAYLQDGIAMVQFIRHLKENPEAFTEYTVADRLTALRSQREHARGNSFDTICGYRDHGAMMHYKATPESSYALKAEGLLLVDSGGQYLTGTTDITRTIALGPLSDQEKFDYTITLKSMRYLADAIFMKGATGTHLDGLCRHHMWRHGLDYKCGTGHGLGFHLGVHEGPQNFSMHLSPHQLVPGMVITDEPGVYREGISGVRIEDTLIVAPHLENAFGTFYRFDNVTLVPYEREAILTELLSREEIDGINAFHQQVYQTLAPYLDVADRAWLELATAPII